MGMQGNLQDMAVADLIQQYCQDQKTARLTIEHDGGEGVLFFRDGGVIHATCLNTAGEQAVFEMLMWEQGAFTMETGMDAPEVTITRTWSGLLMEGMRYQDEARLKAEQEEARLKAEQEEARLKAEQAEKVQTKEEKQMAENLGDILKELAGEVSGYISSAVVGVDGLNIADHTAAKIDLEITSAQVALFLQQVDLTVTKLDAGLVEENLLTAQHALLLMRFLPQRKYFLLVQADRKTGNLGNLRMITKVYATRIAESMPNNPKPKSKGSSGNNSSGPADMIKNVFSFP
jgi:predicted regulator of Ras-like GTPase activity (Roadblock/LC7/MglB family)